VSVSGPGRWFYRGTQAMRRVHFVAEKRLGRLIARQFLKTRISPVPVLIVHGDKDLYFPPEHARQLYEGAREPKELWLIPGFGHAERATDDELVDRIVAWVTEAVTRPAAAAGHEPTATSQ